MGKEILRDVPINDLIPYDKNYLNHDNNREFIKNSIGTFDFTTPIEVDENMVILAGHGRLEAAKMLNMETIPFVLKISGWDEKKKTAYRYANNSAAGKAEIIFDNVEFDLDIIGDDYDLGDFGFDMNAKELAPEVVEDEAPEAPEEPKTKRGDIYELGNHRVMCGDSTIITDVEKLMDGQMAELLFTSPPYSDMREYNGNKDLSIDKISDFIQTFYNYSNYQCINLGIKRDNHNIVCYWDEYIEKAKNCGYKFLSWNVWCKQNAGSVGNQSAFIPIAHEWIFVFGKEFKDINRTEERKTDIKKRTSRTVREADGSMKITSIGKQEKLKEMESWLYCNAEMGSIRKSHPATFPVELPIKYISAITCNKDIVVEPFCGSGSTLIACEQTNRICYGMELDEKYCDVIVQRYVNFTGNTKIKLNGEEIEWQTNKT